MIDYSRILSQKACELKPSGIRRFFDIAAEMKGVISLGVGEPDFKTPFAIRESGIHSLERGKTWYTANAGLADLRSEIAAYLQRRFTLAYDPASEIIVTVGGSEAIDLCIRAMIDPGDEVLIPEPSFVAYAPIAQLAHAVVTPIPMREEDEFRLTPEALARSVTPKTKLLILPFPNNPTGAIMPREDLERIADVLRGTDIMVLSDEIYAELTYGIKHVSFAAVEGMRERTVLVNGFSKAYAMTGWRLGYCCAPAPVAQQMLKIHQYAIMCSPTVSQHAGITALRACDGEIEKMAREYDMRRRLCIDGFNRMGLHCFEARGAFYVFPSIRSTGMNSEDFCRELLYGKQVAVIPGTAFGESGEGHIRVSYSYSVNHLLTAIDRIGEFVRERQA